MAGREASAHPLPLHKLDPGGGSIVELSPQSNPNELAQNTSAEDACSCVGNKIGGQGGGITERVALTRTS